MALPLGSGSTCKLPVSESSEGFKDSVSGILKRPEEAVNESLKKSQENDFGHWRKEDPSYVVAESLTKLLPELLWK